MKKIKYLLLVIMCIFLLTGCNSKKEDITLNLESVKEKLNNTELFNETEELDADYIESKYGLSFEHIKNYSVFMVMRSVKASMYAIFEVDDMSVKSDIENYFIKNYVDSWTVNVYDAHEADLVNNMTKETYGNYLIYIVSEDNDEALKIIKGND